MPVLSPRHSWVSKTLCTVFGVVALQGGAEAVDLCHGMLEGYSQALQPLMWCAPGKERRVWHQTPPWPQLCWEQEEIS